VAEAGGGEIWIRDVTLISPERAAAVPHAHVLVRAGRIAWVGTAPPAGLSPQVKTVDGTARYLVPGLIDGHVHLAEVPGVSWDQAARMPAVVESYFRQLPRSYLYFGFTAVVDLAVVDRARVEQLRSAAIGPAVFDCGGPLALANGYPMGYLPSPERFARFPNFLYDPRQADSIPAAYPAADHTPEAAVARVAAGGGICVKSAYESGFGAQQGTLPTPTEALMREVVAASHRRHLPLLLHANSLTAHRFATAVHVDAVAHGLWNWEVHAEHGLPDEIRRVLDDERAAGIATMATLRVIGGLADLFSPEFLDEPHLAQVLPRELVDWYRTEDGRWFARELARDFEGVPAERIHQILARGGDAGAAAIAYFVSSGGELLFGSDTPSGPTYANPPGYNGYLELLALEKAGISPRQILAAATLANAKFFGLAADYGTIEPGKRASLLVLRADPLASVSAFDAIEAVILGDRVIARADLAAPR
jgi:imidazolonepropionase-like amidohydrolase